MYAISQESTKSYSIFIAINENIKSPLFSIDLRNLIYQLHVLTIFIYHIN